MAEKIFSDEQHQFIGNDLSGVVFVRGYIQLQFNPPPTVNAYTPVTVITEKVSATQGAPEFANLLIAQVNKVVNAFEIIPDSHISFRFQDGSEIQLSIRPDDYTGPEAVNLLLRDGVIMVI